MDTASEMNFKLGTWLGLLASRDPTPAGGSLALATLAGAASLASKCARLSGMDNTSFESLSKDFDRFALDDVALYTAISTAGPCEREKALDESTQHIRKALELLESTVKLKNMCNSLLKPDLYASLSLARTATGVLLGNLAANQSKGQHANMEDLTSRWDAVDLDVHAFLPTNT